MPIDKKSLDRMKKLLALAKQGVGGEAANAERFLQSALARHGMTIDDITSDTQRAAVVMFRYRDTTGRRLIIQVISKVIDSVDWQTWRRGNTKAIGAELTPAQHAEVIMHLAVLEPALRRHMKRAFSAFVVANHLYPQTRTHDKDPGPAMDDAEIEMIRAMAAGSETPQVRKALPHNTQAKPTREAGSA